MIVQVIEEAGTFIAVCEAVPMYGQGANPDEAVRDLFASLDNLWSELDAGRAHLSPELAEQVGRLDALMVKSLPLR